MKNRFVTVAVAVIVVVGGALVPTTASAEDGSESTLETLESLTSISEEGSPTAVLENVAPVSAPPGEDLVATVADTEIVLPSDPSDPLKVGDLVVTLEAAEGGEAATPLTFGAVEYRTAGEVSTVPIVKDDGSVQIVTVIPDSFSPSEYGYEFALPTGGQITAFDEVIAITDAAGNFLGGVAPAWAVDANGTPVPTHYEIRDTTLVQVVEHSDAYAYPVTADPYLGGRLFGQIGYYSNGSFSHWSDKGNFVRVIPTAWGRAAQVGGVPPYGWSNGQSILRHYGWLEIINYLPAVARNSATIRQQYDCHVFGAYPWMRGGGAWDLEIGRKSRPWWLTDGGAWSYQCNWP